MATYRFAVQATGRPYGPCESMERAKWADVSRHTTLSAACKRLDRELDDMRRACGPTAWDNHFRVVALRDLRLTWECRCEGSHGRDYRGCTEAKQATIAVVVNAGEPVPVCPTPEGWVSTGQCLTCETREQAAYSD